MTDQAAEKPNPYAKCKPGDDVGDLVTRGKLPRVWDGEQWISLLEGLNQSLVEINEIAKRHYTKRFDSLVGCPAEYSESISVWKGKRWGQKIVLTLPVDFWMPNPAPVMWLNV